MTDCSGHATLADEWRGYAGDALRLLEPLVERVRTQPPDPDHPEPSSCADCPVCAVITVLRGGRSELAVRLADQAAELLAVLRTALDEGVGAPEREPRPPGTSHPPRVQRIAVARDDQPVGPRTGPC
ncbi:hypothetical protein [Pseudonocardia acaciae]|uniref:hypothetical protein n=1 Tax=Pseudonocardia acaciae TaxID=551276 RepID=UPI000685BA8A|nr:hypothetical protein [Pseudonocardia acaciae]